jgi:serpin B
MRFSPRSLALPLGLLLGALAACSTSSDDASDDTTQPIAVAKSDRPRADATAVPPADLTAVADGNNAFAFDLHAQLSASPDNAGKNLFFSPLSLTLALGMTSAGAKGATQSEIAQAMHFALPQDSLQPALNALSQGLAKLPTTARDHAKQDSASNDPDVALTIVNALWGEKTDSWRPDFLDVLATNYGAGMNLGDFKGNADGERLTINQWVADQTQDRIKDLLAPGSLTSDTRLVLVNAINLTFPWETPFEASRTTVAPFTVEGASTVSVPLMAQTNNGARYAEDDLAQYTTLPLYDYSLTVDLFVPKEGKFQAFEAALATETASLRAAEHGSQLSLTLPKFTYTTAPVELGPALRQLGMVTPFSSGADFSGMTTTEPLQVRAVYHKAMVDIDEIGIQAAAATAIESIHPSDHTWPKATLHVDRSFFLGIRHIQTGALLFFGRIIDPTQT